MRIRIIDLAVGNELKELRRRFDELGAKFLVELNKELEESFDDLGERYATMRFVSVKLAQTVPPSKPPKVSSIPIIVSGD